MLHLSQVFVHKNQFKTETKEEILSCLIWNPPQPSNLTFWGRYNICRCHRYAVSVQHLVSWVNVTLIKLCEWHHKPEEKKVLQNAWYRCQPSVFSSVAERHVIYGWSTRAIGKMKSWFLWSPISTEAKNAAVAKNQENLCRTQKTPRPP